MTKTDFREIGARLKTAFRLTTRPLAVYGSEVLPEGIPPMTGVNRCFAVSLYRMATGNEVSAIYVSADTSEGCCMGGLYHVGYIPVPNDIKYFVSTGRKDVRGGAAEFLKASPELVEQCALAAGPIHPPGKYLIVQACEALRIPGLKSGPSAALARGSRSGTWQRSSTSTGTTRSHLSSYPGALPARPLSRFRRALQRTRHPTPRSWARRTDTEPLPPRPR